MTREEFAGLVVRLFDDDGQDVAQRLHHESGPAVAAFLEEAAKGVSRAYELEALFGRGQRRWEVRVDGDTVHFDRLEYHEIPGDWSRMVESFSVPMPSGLEEVT